MRSWRIVGVALAGSLIVAGCASGGNSGQANVAPPPDRPKFSAVGDITYPAQLRVGRPGKIALTLRNDGTVTPKDVTIQFSAGYFDGLILQSTEPAKPNESSTGGGRFFRFAGLEPGAEQAYQLNLVAKAAGEYPFTISLYADQQVIKQSKGKTVVLP